MPVLNIVVLSVMINEDLSLSQSLYFSFFLALFLFIFLSQWSVFTEAFIIVS